MGISNFRVENITDSSADAKWETDMDATTELKLGEVMPDGSCNMTLLPKVGSPGMSHAYPVSGMAAGKKYMAEAASYDEGMGEYMLCDDGSSPASFETPVMDGDVETMSVSSDKAEISVGGSAVITVIAKYSGGAPAKGEKLSCNITNGRPRHRERGTFSPAEPVTDASGKAVITFTANHPGKAKIQIIADNFSCELEIMVKP